VRLQVRPRHLKENKALIQLQMYANDILMGCVYITRPAPKIITRVYVTLNSFELHECYYERGKKPTVKET
jgi:hypothetical protein